MNDQAPWGVASNRRGAGHELVARQFVKDFPVGTYLLSDKFDQWCFAQNLLPMPSAIDMAHKASDGWVAHLQRRQKVKRALNRAGMHPRMNQGSTPFIIVVTGPDEYFVRAPEVEVVQPALIRKMRTILRTYHTRTQYLLQSPAYGLAPPELKGIALQVYLSQDDFDEMLLLYCKQRETRLEYLEREFLKIAPPSLLLTAPDGEEDDDDDEGEEKQNPTLEDLGL